MPEPDQVVELGSSGTAEMHHGVDLSKPAPQNPAEREAQRDAMRDYVPGRDGEKRDKK